MLEEPPKIIHRISEFYGTQSEYRCSRAWSLKLWYAYHNLLLGSLNKNHNKKG